MILTTIFSVPLFYLIVSSHLLFITIGMIGLSVLLAITCAPLNSYMVSLFPLEYRYSAFGTAFNTGISLFGGTTPLVLLWLIDQTGVIISTALYYVFGAVIGLASIALCE